MKALLLIDIQNDFLPGGALAVAHGEEVIPVANAHLSQYDLVVATQDWHPADHRSFASQHAGQRVFDQITLPLPNQSSHQQILWPDHCVQHTRGAELAPGLSVAEIDQVIQKGIDREFDSYSGFFDNARAHSTGLEAYLRERGVEEVHVLGLATDYCVRATALDALRLGFRVVVISAGCRGVEQIAGDCERAFEEMRQAGAEIR
ncbi:bifunctional nicotinamidase/pyrazinamidase [Anatilimnocola sp. NA78]|uniref:bifunctional nicotinamidase/pyrazinamidase n=1 Tax=Anatilimnocola sp. NA78 TaxID=3415683 RepID=UPI003CE5813E